MTAPRSSIQESYAGALREYLRRQDEETLFEAYEIGRQSLARGHNVLDMVRAHQQSVIVILGEHESAERARDLAARSAQFCLESLSPFEMGQHGLMDSVTTLNQIAMDLASTAMALRAEAARREEAEKTLEERAAELAESNAELEQFAYIASHDLQEPVRSLVAYSTLLREDLGKELSEDAATDLDYITKAANRMQRLITDLLAYSRAGRAAMKTETVSLDECVDESFEALRSHLEQSGVRIERQALPTVVGDATLLTQLYQNLLSNAVKFAGEGQPVVELTAQQTGDVWTLGVRDNGIGLEPEYAEQIFEPFKRLHGITKYQGTGIGLAICRKSVDRHGGRIWVESKPAEGAHFKFTLPHRGNELEPS